ncbi:MAG: glycine dehydrogenase [Eubacteriales bacterium]|nr:glycine dehydrogenase [Eubacteriales bacterium]
MSRYIPHTPEQKTEMLREIGIESVEQLFEDVPESIKLKKPLDLPDAMSEPELAEHMKELAGKCINTDEYACFLGAGAYDHYIPAAVKHITSRQEFYTSYTPYQPEISQGMLQAIFEYQSMICALTGMDVSNASMYDGASALAEAALMSCAATGKKKVLVSRTVHPEYRRVLGTYSKQCGFALQEIGYVNGVTDIDILKAAVDNDTAAVLVQNPNFFGAIEPLDKLGEVIKGGNIADAGRGNKGGIGGSNKGDIAGGNKGDRRKIMFTVCANPVSLAVLEPPGSFGADIVVGEGQPLGNPLSFGGPYLGFFAAREEHLRKMPGRIVGQTVDKQGRRGFVLTIQAREQHIRREKATSNICSNQALNALAAAVYLTVTGKEGLKDVALTSMQKAHYTYESLLKTGGFEKLFDAPFFNEFAVKPKASVDSLNAALLEKKILGGLDLERYYPEMQNGWLVAVTEKRTRAQIDSLLEVAKTGMKQPEGGAGNDGR